MILHMILQDDFLNESVDFRASCYSEARAIKYFVKTIDNQRSSLSCFIKQSQRNMSMNQTILSKIQP